jgi:hypothetical protein
MKSRTRPDHLDVETKPIYGSGRGAESRQSGDRLCETKPMSRSRPETGGRRLETTADVACKTKPMRGGRQGRDGLATNRLAASLRAGPTTRNKAKLGRDGISWEKWTLRATPFHDTAERAKQSQFCSVRTRGGIAHPTSSGASGDAHPIAPNKANLERAR